MSQKRQGGKGGQRSTEEAGVAEGRDGKRWGRGIIHIYIYIAAVVTLVGVHQNIDSPELKSLRPEV